MYCSYIPPDYTVFNEITSKALQVIVDVQSSTWAAELQLRHRIFASETKMKEIVMVT